MPIKLKCARCFKSIPVEPQMGLKTQEDANRAPYICEPCYLVEQASRSIGALADDYEM